MYGDGNSSNGDGNQSLSAPRQMSHSNYSDSASAGAVLTEMEAGEPISAPSLPFRHHTLRIFSSWFSYHVLQSPHLESVCSQESSLFIYELRWLELTSGTCHVMDASGNVHLAEQNTTNYSVDNFTFNGPLLLMS